MSIVIQHDSRSGATYAYHNDVTWDRQLKRSFQKRTLIGRIDPDTTLIVPTSGKHRKNLIDEEVIKKEIEEYNNRILRKNNDDKSSHSDHPEKLTQPENADLEELILKYEGIKQALISFSETIQQIFDKQSSV